MDTPDLLFRLALALGVGILVGLERGWERRGDAPGTRTAGVRTFTLSALLGGIVAALAQGLDAGGAGILLGLGFLTFSAVLALFAREENRALDSYSVTTVVAGMLTFALGAYAVAGDVRVAAAGAVVVAGLLALREGLHRLVASITWEELRAGLMLAAMTFIALPLLPDRDLGPFGGINPREVWLIATILAAVSFCGYAAVKFIGQTRGMLLAAAAGGLVSSTAIMVNNARRVSAGEATPRLAASGASLATAVSILRTMAVVTAISPSVFGMVAVPLGAAGAAMVAAALALAARDIRDGRKRQDPVLRNPFELRVVVGFALLLGVLEVLASFLAGRFGPSGAIFAALIAGAGDVDAATVSVARLAGAVIPVETAALAVLAGVASNNAAKVIVGCALGGGRFALWVVGAAGFAALAGIGGWLVAATWSAD